MSTLRRFGLLLTDVSNAKGAIDKRGTLAGWLSQSDADQMVKYLNYALSPYIRFHMTGVTAIEGRSMLPPEDVDRIVCQHLDALHRRDITGNAAKQYVQELLQTLDNVEQDALVKILNKDLRAGFDVSTVNKVRPGAVPVFECQLAASKMPGVHELKYPVAAEYKFDGVRTIAIKRAGIVTLFSRNGLSFDNFAELEHYLEAHMPDDTVLDGEVVHAAVKGADGYKLVMKRVQAERGKNVEIPVRYRAFCAMSLKEWDEQKPFRDHQMMRQFLVEIVASLPVGDMVTMSHCRVINSAEEMTDFYNMAVAEGYEGLIVKELGACYQFRRNKVWQKLKPMMTMDLTVDGKEEGKGKDAGRLGALLCSTVHEGKKLKVKVGSGYTDKERDEFWLNTPEMIEVKYQDITSAEDEPGILSLRFPTFERVRPTDMAGKI